MHLLEISCMHDNFLRGAASNFTKDTVDCVTRRSFVVFVDDTRQSTAAAAAATEACVQITIRLICLELI